jgi:aspartokinase/homoserine dehydrogenase 1
LSSILILSLLDGPALNIFSIEGVVLRTLLTCSQASSEHSVCFAVPEKEAEQVRRALEKKFRRDLDAGRLSKV